MTITYKGEINLGQARNSLGVRTYTRQFRLTTSLNTEREYNVGSHASLPQIGSVHPSDSAAYCVGFPWITQNRGGAGRSRQNIQHNTNEPQTQRTTRRKSVGVASNSSA